MLTYAYMVPETLDIIRFRLEFATFLLGLFIFSLTLGRLVIICFIFVVRSFFAVRVTVVVGL